MQITVDDGDPIKFPMKWVHEEGFVYGDTGTIPSEKILALDMDDTLIRTKSKRRFGIDDTDWTFINEKVVTTVQNYNARGYKVIIVTNQGAVEKGLVKLEHILKKIEAVIQAIGVPIQAFVATHKNYYRKPCLGLWKFMEENLNGGIVVDKKSSIFCGDAAGRPKTETRVADFENTDYKFALNCGIMFKTPEMLYDGIDEDLPEIEFHPNQLRRSESNRRGAEVNIQKSNMKEMIIFVGPPSSGKTTFYKNHLGSDYVHVSTYEHKTKEKCMEIIEEAIKEGKSVVIDSTNRKKKSRQEFVELAKKNGYTTRAFLFDVDRQLVKHLNEMRTYNKYRRHHSESVPKIEMTMYFKSYEAPSVEEGFDSVENIEFVPGPFDNKDDEETFFSYVCPQR